MATLTHAQSPLYQFGIVSSHTLPSLSPSLSSSYSVHTHIHRQLFVATGGMPTPYHPLSLLPVLCLLLSPTLATTNYRASGCNGTTDKPKLYIQGFVPADSDIFTSETIVPAASIACQEINSNDSVLSDYELVIEWSDTQVSK